jgi:hypothetical protein
MGQTQLVKKVPSGQRFVFFDLRVWARRLLFAATFFAAFRPLFSPNLSVVRGIPY